MTSANLAASVNPVAIVDRLVCVCVCMRKREREGGGVMRTQWSVSCVHLRKEWRKRERLCGS